ncbi:hypothetical protein Pst134EA_017566 [Puccinia striiformis f. sp. tritici]|uniref:hypothetical protein n=1 Tax=Puccinia striiformis f. sp. tritici TaxID=168172 RepID=UPI002007F89F|nr:hypothetical protein Pst134EA_017566 [Puccinia striiformis f. sp. tritici]KAH9461259.1 hypothetical protein Pst134EA_017566 [Puccinia striiformis f. sp. tritici]
MIFRVLAPPAKLARMAASELMSGAATQYKLGGCAAESIANGLKPNDRPGVCDSLSAQHPSLYRMAAPHSNSDAAIRASFAGSVVPLILVIGQCTIAMEFVRWIPGSEHPSPSINHSTEVAQSSLAAINGIEPISNKQLAASSLLPVAGADPGNWLDGKGILEHCILITSESTTTPGQIPSSHDTPVTRLDSSSEMDHQIEIPNQESSSAQPKPRQGDAGIIKCIVKRLPSPPRETCFVAKGLFSFLAVCGFIFLVLAKGV